ncbi:hypothetical protein SUDANB66_06611 (plasmid) [Streptomyces sp. SudanB66_2053]
MGRWRKLFVEHRIAGLGDLPRSGGPRIRDEQVAAVVKRTLETAPKNATHWSTRAMAMEMGLSQSTVSRIWRAFGLQPHRTETFKLSTDPYFVDKVHDVVGLYLDPPERALGFRFDEKSQIQALDRSQPVPPMMPGVPQRGTHDYVRAGTTTLFAALEVTTGKVVGSLHRRHRAEKCLIKLDQEIPAGLDVHLVLDNYATHKFTGDQDLAAGPPTLLPALHAHRLVLPAVRRLRCRAGGRPIRRAGCGESVRPCRWSAAARTGFSVG